MRTSSLPERPTAGQIADHLGVRLHKVEYVLKARRVAPIGRAGNIRLFDRSVVALVAQELNLMAARREVRHG